MIHKRGIWLTWGAASGSDGDRQGGGTRPGQRMRCDCPRSGLSGLTWGDLMLSGWFSFGNA